MQRGKLSQMTQDVKLYKLCGRSSPQGHVDDQFILPVDQGCAGAEVHLVAGRWSCGGRGRSHGQCTAGLSQGVFAMGLL